MTMKRHLNIFWIISIVLSLLMSPLVLAQSGIGPRNISRVGQSGWQFLKINSDARLAAMGGVITALPKGTAASIFSNPASLVDVKNFDLALSKVNWIADIGYQTVALAKNFGNLGVFGISFASLDYGEMDETINELSPTKDSTIPMVTGETFTAGDMAAGLSYAKSVTDRLSIGGNIRYIRQEIAELSMNNWSLDFGTVYYTGFRSLRLAMVARNFGPDAHLVGFSETYQAEAYDITMPLDFRFGIAIDFFDSQNSPHLLTLSIEGDHPNDGPEKYNMGINYVLKNMLFLRGGYRFNYDEEGVTLGGGLTYMIGEYGGRLDYAYVDFGELKSVHMFSLGISF
jgi:hypothetical protein